MATPTSPAPTSAWSEPELPQASGLLGAGWLPEVLCGLAVLPLVGMVSGAVSVTAAVSVIAAAATLGVGVLILR